MLLSIYKAAQEQFDENSRSEHEIEEVESFDKAIMWCVNRVVEDERYSVKSSLPDDDYAFTFIRAATPVELADLNPKPPIEAYMGDVLTGEVCGKVVKFDLSHTIVYRVKLIREEAERRKKQAAEEAERRRQQLEAERTERKKAADLIARRAQFEALKREFEGPSAERVVRHIPIESVGAERLRVLLRDAGVDPSELKNAEVYEAYRTRFGDSCVINSSIGEDVVRNGGIS